MGKKEKTTSQTYEVKISTKALQNIDEVTGYIAFIKHQPVNAEKVGNALFAAIEKIAVNPNGYEECQELLTKRKMYRRAVCMSWVIYFRVKRQTILLLRVIHSARLPSGLPKELRRIK
jgi:plasmid stabilization system protein ParE